jgi:hypothetical protein
MTTGVDIPQTVALTNVTGVELMKTGTWRLSTGIATFTREDLAEAVGAVDCPSVRNPVIKLGHSEPDTGEAPGIRWDGEPAVGWVGNMALADDGSTVSGDYMGVPSWLAGALPSAYPDRSVEIAHNFPCQAGHVHPCVITAVALLGVVPPGIGTLQSLQDVAALYQAATVPDDVKPVTVTFRREDPPMPDPKPIKAAVSSEDIRRAYYDGPGASSWSTYICEMQMDPLQLITIDESSGDYARVPVTLKGEDITFGDAIPVAVEYVDKKIAASGWSMDAERVLRASLRGEPEPAPAPAPVPEPEPVPAPVSQEAHVEFNEEQLRAVRSRLGLADDAEVTPDQLLAVLNGETGDTPRPIAAGAGQVVIDAAVYAEMEKRLQKGELAFQRTQAAERDAVIQAAVQQGKFPPARIPMYTKAWDNNPEDTRAIIASLTPNRVPVEELGYFGDGEAYNADEFDALFPPNTRPEPSRAPGRN